LFGFGSSVLLFKIVNYFARNSDNLIIGKALGPNSLGYYSVAYNLMLKPLQHISWSVGRVIFPTFSTMQNDKDRVRWGYLKVVRSISLITFPMMAGLMIIAKEFIMVFYGAKWEPAIIPLQLLCIVGALHSIGTTVGSLFTSQGRPDLQLKVGVFNSVMIVIAFFLGIRWGLIGVVFCYMIVSLLLFLPTHFLANRLIHLKMGAFLYSLMPALSCSFLMVLLLLFLRFLSISILNLNMLAILVLLIIIGISFYVALTFFVFNIPEIQELLTFLENRFFAGRDVISKYNLKNYQKIGN